jgi:hypothetical protein
MTRGPRTRVVHAFRRTALPLASYYAITLAVPLANGAAQSGAFVEHAMTVLLGPPVAIILACTVQHALAWVSFRPPQSAAPLPYRSSRRCG